MKIFVVFLLVTILLLGGLFLRNIILQDTIAVKKIEKFSAYAYEVSNGIQGDNYYLEENGTDEVVEARLEVGNLLLDYLNQLITHIQNGQWEEELKVEINVYNTALKYKEMEGYFQASLTDMKGIMRYNEKLLERGLPKEDMDLSLQPTIFMKKVVSLFLSTIGFLAIMLVLGILITREYEEHNIRMINALPVSKTTYIVAKYLSLFIAGCVWLVVVFGLSYLLPTLFGHSVGDIFHYPLSTLEGDFISSGSYINQAILYGFLFMSFAVAILVLLGFLIRNTLLTYLTAIFLFIVTYFLLENGWTNKLNPFTYQNTDFIILNEQGLYPQGMVPLLVTTILLLIVAAIFNRKSGGLR